MPPCNFHTICCTTALCSGNPVPCSPEFLFPCSHILCTLQGLLPPISSSTLPYPLLLLVEAAPLPHNVALSSPILFTEILPLFFSSLLDTPTSCVPLFHARNTLLSAPLLPASLLPLLHTALLNFPIPQIYFLPPSSLSVLFYLSKVPKPSTLSTQLPFSSFQFCPYFGKGPLLVEHVAHEIVVLVSQMVTYLVCDWLKRVSQSLIAG